MKKILEEYGIFLIVSILILGMLSLFWSEVKPHLEKVLPQDENAILAFEEMKILEDRQKPIILAEHLHLKKGEVYEIKKLVKSLIDSSGTEQKENIFFLEVKEKQAFYAGSLGDELIVSCDLLDDMGNLASDVEGDYKLNMEYIDSYGIEISKSIIILVT